MDGENCSECVGRASKLSLEQKCEPFCDTTGYKLPAKTTTFPCESTNGSVEDITTDPGDQRPSSANVTGLGSISEQEDEVSLLEWLEKLYCTDVEFFQVLSISSGNHLSPSSTSSTTLQLARHKGEGDHIPRPPNAFILFRSSWWKKHECLPGHETNHREISRMAGRAWKSLSYEEKKPYIELAGVRKHEHRMRYPGYKFAPSHAHRKSKAREKIVAPKGLWLKMVVFGQFCYPCITYDR